MDLHNNELLASEHRSHQIATKFVLAQWEDLKIIVIDAKVVRQRVELVCTNNARKIIIRDMKLRIQSIYIMMQGILIYIIWFLNEF